MLCCISGHDLAIVAGVAPNTCCTVHSGGIDGWPIDSHVHRAAAPSRAACRRLQKLAYNLWWCWNHEAVSLFRRIDDDLFDAVENSPVKLLGAIDQERLDNWPTTTASWPTWTASRKPSTTT